MSSILDFLFGAASFMPHGYCLLWRPDLVALHAASDFTIATAYIAIPLAMLAYYRRRPDTGATTRRVGLLFVAFIIACAATHLAALLTLWYPAYGAQGLVKAATAVVSIATAIFIWPLVPRFVQMPTVEQLQELNQQLRDEVREHNMTRKRLVAANEELARKAQALAESNKELEAFSYSVSHDLHAPLRSINGFSTAIEEDFGDRLDDGGRDMLKRVRESAKRMGQLIDGLLDLSRVARAPVVVEEVDLTRIAQDTVRGLGEQDPEREVSVSIEPNLRTDCDPQLMRIVFANLIGNAWKYTAKESKATIEVGRLREAGHEIYFVRDNGVGFSSEHAERIFEPFRRLHSESDYPGTGIGLATVERIIRRHGGTIEASSEVGSGTEIRFTIGQPAQSADETETRASDLSTSLETGAAPLPA